MTDQEWTVEVLELYHHSELPERFRHVQGILPPDDPDSPTPTYDKTLLGFVRARMRDGRLFEHVQWISAELVEDYGKEWVKEMLRVVARPPE